MSSKLVIKGGYAIDPSANREGKLDVLVDRGQIAAIESSISVDGAKALNVDGKLVVPGLVDLHAHLREPGREDKETIKTGIRSAVRGGFTTVCAMPNTEPPIDNRGAVDFIYEACDKAGLASVRAIGAITIGRQGRELTSFGELFDAGCVALSDDGNPVADGLLMRRALEYARIFGRPLIQHAEDTTLAAGGVMHEGLVSTTLGLRGIPSEAESVIVGRDLALAELTGGWIHFAHLSCARSVELIRQAKKRGVRVTCEVTPHHIALTHEAVGTFDAIAKVNPPLRTEEDRQALIEGLRDGTIDCIATDHSPHTDWEKASDFDSAPFGISGLETALSVCADVLVGSGVLTWRGLIEKLSSNPARIAGLNVGTLQVGAPADLIVLEQEARWTVDPGRFLSKGRSSPFAGRSLPGRVLHVLCRGRQITP